jgi:hypothetical protein
MTVVNPQPSSAYPDIVDLYWNGTGWSLTILTIQAADGSTSIITVPPPGPGNTAFLGGFLDNADGTVTDYPTSGTIPIAGPTGNITGNPGSWILQGSGQIGVIGEYDGPMTYTLAPGSNITANGVYVSTGSSVEITSTADATFQSNSGTLALAGTTPVSFSVEGFVAGDVIDFAGQANLTISTDDVETPGTQATIWSGKTPVDTINFDQNTDNWRA